MLRRDGMDRALRAAGIDGEVDFDGLQLPGNDLAAARALGAAFHSGEHGLARDNRPTAVICHHDVLAAGFLAGLRTTGVAVPAQVAVAGNDDGPLAEGLGLTTVRQPFAESGRHAAELLRSLIQSPEHSAARTLLAPQLVVRETT
jgi:LacI family transcriptional regulator